MWEQLKQRITLPKPEDGGLDDCLEVWSWIRQLHEEGSSTNSTAPDESSTSSSGNSSIYSGNSSASFGASSSIDWGDFITSEDYGWEAGVSWFKLVFAIAFIPIGLIFVVMLFRARHVFEIRARSARLAVLTGINAIIVMAWQIPMESVSLFGYMPHVLALPLANYYSLLGICCCYMSRMIRLAVVYNPSARRRLPWLLSEERHVIACIVVPAILALIPLYDYLTIVVYGDKIFELRHLEFVTVVDDQLWVVQLVSELALLSLYPLIRNVDDIFAISPELRVLSVWLVATTIGVKVAEETCPQPVIRALSDQNLVYVAAVVSFCFTVVEPLRRLAFSSHRSSQEMVAKVLAGRTTMASGDSPERANFRKPDGRAVSYLSGRGYSQAVSLQRSENGESCMRSDTAVVAPRAKIEQQRLGREELGGADLDRRLASEVVAGIWTYERVAAVPEFAAAFDEFARKALCQESVLFLQEVTRYQRRTTDDDMGINPPEPDADFAGFQEITKGFIVDGSPDEVNISSEDKKVIMDLYNGGKTAFQALSPKDRRLVFGTAYKEVRYMLEVNLMTRFVQTNEFRSAYLEVERSWRNGSSPAV